MILLYYLIIIVLVYMQGIWLTALFLPRKLSNYKILIPFPLGLVWTIIISSWFSYLGFGFNSSYKYILIISFCLGGVTLYNEIRLRLLRSWIPEKRTLIIILLAIIAGGSILMPYVLFNAGFPYGDIFTYISIADYLSDHGYFVKADPNPYSPWLTQMKLYQDGGFRMGGQFFLSFISSSFHEEYSIKLLPAVQSFVHLCLVVSMYLFCRIGLSLNYVPSVLATIFTAFHLSMPISSLQFGFFPQAIGIVLMLILFLFYTNINDWAKERSRYIITTSAVTTGLIITYSELLPFVCLAFVGCALYTIYKNKKAVYYSTILIIYGLLTILLSNIALINAIHAIKMQLNVLVGWNVTNSLWNYIMIYFSLNEFHTSEYSIQYPLINFGLSLAVVFSIILIFRFFLLNEFIEVKKSLILLTAPFVLLLCYFIFFTLNPWQPSQLGHTWNIYKVSNYLFFLFPPIVAISLYSYFQKFRRKVLIYSVVITGYIMLMVVQNYYFSNNLSNSMRLFSGNEANPLAEYFELQQRISKEERPINLIIPDDAIQHKKLLSYFLRDHEIVTDWSKDDGYISPYLKAEYKSPKYASEGKTLVYNPAAKEKWANMEILGDKPYLNFSTGFYGYEHNKEHNWRWSAGEGTISTLNMSKNSQRVTLEFSVGVATMEENKVLEIWQKDHMIDKVQIDPNKNNNVKIQVVIPSGENELTFKYSGVAVQAGADPRKLSFMLQDFTYYQEEEVTITFDDGFYPEETDKKNVWRWSGGKGMLKVVNSSLQSKEIVMKFQMLSADQNEKRNVDFLVNSKETKEVTLIPNEMNDIELTAQIAPGNSTFEFLYNGKAHHLGSDTRDLAFYIKNFKYEVKE